MKEYHLETPLSEEDVRKLRVGDVVYITGRVHTARDMAHKHLVESED
ncbi:MAG: fumarate hydratase C-terminal domain-containing protein, partial [Candidatus Altiarchaeota archaeon]